MKRPDPRIAAAAQAALVSLIAQAHKLDVLDAASLSRSYNLPEAQILEMLRKERIRRGIHAPPL